jgi:hypothetical protein
LDVLVDIDEKRVTMDALFVWREQVPMLYDLEDQANYIAVANRILARIDPPFGVSENNSSNDGHGES